MELKAKDKKILEYLYHHYREPLTEISKACKVSRDQVEYLLEKYISSGLIKKFVTLFNYPLLGYKEFVVVWFKLNEGDKENIKKSLESMKNVISVGESLNKYDLFVDFVFKDRQEFEETFSKFLNNHRAMIKDYSIFMTYFVEFFPLKVFGSNKNEKDYIALGNSLPIKLDDKEIEIMKLLEQDGRMKIVDIASKTGFSSELIIYKMKQLHKKGVILGSRIFFDMEKLGYYFASLRLNIHNLNETLRKKLKLFCSNHKSINALAFGIADFNCVVQFFYKEEQELRKSISQLKELLKEELRDSELLLIEKEGAVKTLPF